MKNKKKAFTLVELLAVIVILAIILVIAIPQIIKTINASKLSAMESSAKLLATNAEKDYLSQLTLNQYYNATSIPCTDVAKLNDDYDIDNCSITYNDGIATVILKGADGGKFEGIVCSGTKDNMICKKKETIYVTYNANGGTIEDNETRKIGYDFDGEEYIPTANYIKPIKDSSIFKGWYKDSNLTQEFVLDENNIPEEVEGITVYAKWLDVSKFNIYIYNK